MAREQTEDLPTRGLRPANVVGGQYRVAVQQAPESGYTKLARSLSNVSAGLQAYAKAGQTVSEMYEQEVQDMNLQQVKASKEKMEARLDKAERKGKLPFLGNPLNWERNQKALARRYAALLHNQTTSSEGRFQNGKQANDWSLSVGEILDQEREKFLRENPELTQNPLMLQVFEGEWQQRSNMMHQRFSDQKRKEMLAETTRETANSIIDSFTDEMDAIDADKQLTGIQKDQAKIRIKQAIVEKWGDLNALSPINQLAVIRKISKILADTDPQEAYDFLEFAKENLKVGANLLGEETATIRDIKNLIKEAEEESTNVELKDLQESHKISELKGTNDLSAYEILEAKIINGEAAVWNDKEYTTKQELKSDFLEYARNLEDKSRGAFIIREINERLDRNPNSVVASQVQQLADKQIDIVRLYSDSFSKMLSDLDITDKIRFPINSRESRDLQTEFLTEMNRIVQTVSQDLATGTNRDGQFGTPEEAAKIFESGIDGKAEALNNVLNMKFNELSDQYEQRATKLQDQFIKAEEDRQADTISATNLEAIKIGAKYNGDKQGKELAQVLSTNLKVAALGDEKQRDVASDEFWSVYSNDLAQGIISGEIKWKVKPQDPTVVVQGGQATIIERPGVEYTEEDREAWEDVYIKVQSLSGVLTSLDKMKQDPENPNIYIHTKETIDPNQGRFSYTTYPVDTREINSRYHRILTRDEINANDPTDPVVIEKAKRVGKDGITPRELLDNQREWYKQYSEFIERLGIE